MFAAILGRAREDGGTTQPPQICEQRVMCEHIQA